MTIPQTDESIRPKPLRVWPGVVVVALQWLLWWGVSIVTPEAGAVGAIGGLVGGLLVVVWWAFFSRAPRLERYGAVVLTIVALAAAPRILHESIATGGMGMLFYVYAVPWLSLAFVACVVACRRLSEGPRRAALAATILLACGAWALFRTAGVTATGSEFAWRWSATPEERLLARAGDEPMASRAAPPVEEGRAEWPGFRGPARDGVVAGVRIETDWSQSPPVELWRRAVGPGWSSFAVHGDLVYTQEQRGDDEVVSCYDAATGAPVWWHRDTARFWESNAGPGPRATPTLDRGRVYALGATGILNALDAADGSVVWSRDLAADSGREVPYWGFSSSPLVVGDLVVVAAAGTLVAYDLETGVPRWLGPAGGDSYSSPQRMTIDGVEQILLLDGDGATSVAPADGTVLWRHGWPGSAIVQPARTADGDLLIGSLGVTGGTGIRRIAVARGPGGWTVEERWTSSGLKPYFNDFVVHEGHAYGFDGSILACIDLGDGTRCWKGGRYGQGQLVLLREQGLLLVVSERGELALVAAAPDRFEEIARFPAIAGKSWNHPVVVGDLLLVRSDEEMAAFRLSLVGG